MKSWFDKAAKYSIITSSHGFAVASARRLTLAAMLRLCSSVARRGIAVPALRVATAHVAAPRLTSATQQLPTLQTLPRRWFAASNTFLSEEDVTDRVLGCVKSFQKVDPTKVTVNSHFLNDLGLDSLDTVEVVMAFEDEFVVEIPDADAEKIHTCEDAIKYILAHPAAK
eukprot:6183514-Pleurochrysis_carterae.AAC.2